MKTRGKNYGSVGHSFRRDADMRWRDKLQSVSASVQESWHARIQITHPERGKTLSNSQMSKIRDRWERRDGISPIYREIESMSSFLICHRSPKPIHVPNMLEQDRQGREKITSPLGESEKPEQLTHLPFIIRHTPPFGRSEHALLGGLGLIAKDLFDQFGIAPDPLQKHEICAEWLLGSIRVLDVPPSRFSRLALRSSECVLALNVVRSERPHIRS